MSVNRNPAAPEIRDASTKRPEMDQKMIRRGYSSPAIQPSAGNFNRFSAIP